MKIFIDILIGIGCFIVFGVTMVLTAMLYKYTHPDDKRTISDLLDDL